MATQLSFGSRKSPARQAFELYLRYGIVADPGLQEEKQGYNPYRAEDGRFDFAPGHGTLPPRIDQANMGHGAGQRRTTPMAGGKNIPLADAPRRQVRELLRQRPRPSGLSEDAILAAQASEKALGVPTAITLAQYGLESAWGRRMPPGSNNPFGIKAKPGEPLSEWRRGNKTPKAGPTA